MINDFSGIVLFKKIFIPHMEVFFSLELPPPVTLEFLQTGHEWVLGDGTTHSDLESKNVSIYPEKVLFSL